MSTIQTLLSQKMALERMIEQARIDELDRQRRIESERLAMQNAEIGSLVNLKKNYERHEIIHRYNNKNDLMILITVVENIKSFNNMILLQKIG